MNKKTSAAAAKKNVMASTVIANGAPSSSGASVAPILPDMIPCRASVGSEMMLAAIAGERMPDSDHIVCIIPFARGNCFSDTIIAYDVSKAEAWNAPNIALKMIRINRFHNCSVWVIIINASKMLRQPFAKSTAIIVRLRSCRSAHAPAIGAPKTVGKAKKRLTIESAMANSGFCSGSGYNVCVNQIVTEKKVSAEPNTEIDWVNQTIRKVRKPLGGA